ncbi:MAG TPA: RdgB/HAM1 family non-canonical purine NTP pyrophosphatase [Mycobacteriales bacterium]|nr:RdgB/HAM1 family non-canonical purine NTP pyrophosphatase [Mycobacteriales bacterium]
MTATVVLATRNKGKIEELRRILDPYDVELLGLDAYPDLADVVETGATFADNALLKAHAACRGTGLPSIADDSGLAVDALNQMPGVLSARWAGRHGDDVANLELVLAQISDLPDSRRGAAFVCAAAAAMPDGRDVVVEGRLAGHLARSPRGSNGFGYDPIFVPLDDDRTTAEMPPEEKDAISHRGKAFRALAPLLAGLLGSGESRAARA